jgi:hypothetical protein
MLISPPDSVLAEAGAMKPRPSIASTLAVAEPTLRIAWWPERRHLIPGTLSRLRWMVETAGGRAWLIFDPTDDDALTVDEVRTAAEAAGFSAAREVPLDPGDIALELSLS